MMSLIVCVFFFQAEDGIRDDLVTGVQTCALPISHSKRRRFRNLLRGRDVQELKELQRQGMSIQAISELTGWDRKTIRKYVQAAGGAPEYGPRPAPPSKLDAFKLYLEERLRAGGWDVRGLLRRWGDRA